MAEELEIHIRTVYRCIDSLCASGVPIIADSGPNGGYQIMSHFTQSPLLFDMEEQQALVQASVLAHEAGYPFKEALMRAVDKLKRYTNDNQLDRIERHVDGFSVVHPPIEERHQGHLRKLETAAVGGRSVKLMHPLNEALTNLYVGLFRFAGIIGDMIQGYDHVPESALRILNYLEEVPSTGG